MCMIHYNWGSVRRDLPADKLFISKDGIRSFIESNFKSARPTDWLIEISKISEIDCKGNFHDCFRVSQLCENFGFDEKELIRQEMFWLLFDDNEVEDPDAE